MSETAESFHETLRSLCVLYASAVYMLSLTAETQRTQRLRREFLDFLLLSRSLKVGGAPENVLIFTSRVAQVRKIESALQQITDVSMFGRSG